MSSENFVDQIVRAQCQLGYLSSSKALEKPNISDCYWPVQAIFPLLSFSLWLDEALFVDS